MCVEEEMKTEMLVELLKQYPVDSVPFVRIGMGTMHRIDKGQVKSSAFDHDLYEVRGVEREEKTGAPVLLLEVPR